MIAYFFKFGLNYYVKIMKTSNEGLSPNFGYSTGLSFSLGGSRFSSTSTALFSTCYCS